MRRKRVDFKAQAVRKIPTVDSYRLPETLGAAPENVRLAHDACFSRNRTMLSHALEGMAAEGMPAFVGYPMLAGLSQNGLIRAGIEMRADEMTREWGEFSRYDEGGNEIIDQLEKDFDRFYIKELFNKVAAYCGYFGGCLVFIDTGENELANPLTLETETFSKGDLKGFKLVEPWTVSPGIYNSINPLKTDYYKPPIWYVQGVPVHTSRFLYFTENELPTLLKPAYNFFGISLSQKVFDAVSHFTDCRESANRLLKKYATTVFKTDMDAVLSGGFDNALQARVKYFIQNRDNDGCATIDKEREDLVVMTTSLSGVTDIVRQAMEYVAAMFNEPVTKMWGLSPNGFNTGDSDLRNHYDNIAALQEKLFRKALTRLTIIMQLNDGLEIDKGVEFKFNPLSKEDESLKAATAKTQAETDVILIDAGIISPDEARQRLVEDENGGYNGLEPYTEPAPLDPNNPNAALEPFDDNESTGGGVKVITV